MSGYNLYWGDTHTNLHLPASEQAAAAFPAGGVTHTNLEREVAADLARSVAHARQVLDFWPIAYYPFLYRMENGFRIEDWRDERELEVAWRAICDLAATGGDENLVIFPGFEWQGDNRHGDHNVFFLDDHPPLLRADTLPALYAEIRARGLRAIAIPHHTAYHVGARGKDWSVHDEELSPFAEVFSLHGSSETDAECPGLRQNWHMGPGVSGGTIADGLDRGLRIGIIASGDSHYGVPGVWGAGLMGCYAERLTRESLWEAFAARRVYGVTGDRIELEFCAAGAEMGSVTSADGPVRALVRVRGCDAIDRIELLRNNRPIAVHNHELAWSPAAVQGRTRFKLRVEAGWGPTPGDVPHLPEKVWAGAIEVSDGAVVAAEPCWRRFGQSIGPLGGRRCEFGFVTAQDAPRGQVPTEATIFEIEAAPADAVTIELNGRKVSMSVAEAMAGSRLVHLLDDARELIRRVHGVDAGALGRTDRLHFYAYKAKIHRAIPEAAFAAELDHTDPAPPAGVNVYRARVTQRNGQMAWSSPVWVECG